MIFILGGGAACSALNSPADNMKFISLWDFKRIIYFRPVDAVAKKNRTPRPPRRPAAKLEPNSVQAATLLPSDFVLFVTNILQRKTCLPETIMHLINAPVGAKELR